MRKQVTLKLEAGDANYVKPGERFIEFTPDGKGIASISKRADDLQLETEVSAGGGGSSELDEYLEEHEMQYEIVDGWVYGVQSADNLSVEYLDSHEVTFSGYNSIFCDIVAYFHKDIEYTYTDEDSGVTYKLVVKDDYRISGYPNESFYVNRRYFNVTPIE